MAVFVKKNFSAAVMKRSSLPEYSGGRKRQGILPHVAMKNDTLI
jgi:hypothetical protein